MNNPFDLLIDSYLENNVGIDEHFLTENLSRGLQQNILNLQNKDMMHAAGIGNSTLKDEGQNTRSDRVCWLDKSNDNIFEQQFLQQAEDLIAYMNRTCYTGIKGYEFHYAVYNEGSYYKRHKDQFKNDDDRKFSLISYLNDAWLEEDGGQLLLYHEDSVQSISPRSGKAVFFKSDEMEHEVARTNRPRMSITGWLKSS